MVPHFYCIDVQDDCKLITYFSILEAECRFLPWFKTIAVTRNIDTCWKNCINSLQLCNHCREL